MIAAIPKVAESVGLAVMATDAELRKAVAS